MTTVNVIKQAITVRAGGSAPQVVRVSPQTVARVSAARAAIVAAGGSAAVSIEQSPNRVSIGGVAGVQGPPGPAGTPGGTIQPIAFSYGDASGAIYEPSASGTITVVRLVIEAPFNGAAPSLQLGTLASPAAAMAATDNDPSSAGEYEVTADLRLAAGEPLRITVAPDGSTQGSGRIYLTFIPD